MTDTFEFTLNNPLTEEQWDMITDVDFDRTDHVTFHTKHGKEVEFAKVIRCKECKHMRTDRGNVFCETLEDMFYRYEYEQPINEDFFCAWAEPKDNTAEVRRQLKEQEQRREMDRKK